MTGHIIHKITLQLQVRAYEQAVTIQSAAKQWAIHSFPSLINASLDAMAGDDEIIYLDNLTIELDAYPWQLSSAQWQTKLGALLAVNTSRFRTLPVLCRQWMFFLQWGSFERNAWLKSVKAIESYLVKHAGEWRDPALLSVFMRGLSVQGLLRLYTHHTSEFIAIWFSHLLAINHAEGESARQVVQIRLYDKPDEVLHSLRALYAWSLSRDSKSYREAVKAFLLTGSTLVIPDGQASVSEAEPPGDDNQFSEPDDVFFECPNAGIVILFPYLKRFLQNSCLVDGDQFINEDDRARAVQALFFLATGKQEGDENEYVLMKILCGIPLETPVHFEVILSRQVLEEAKELLQSVISLWDVLQHTSVEGLRETFLQRTGKLGIKEGHFLLQVEDSGVDILLGKLPWGFRNYRLPWMQHPIITEWY